MTSNQTIKERCGWDVGCSDVRKGMELPGNSTSMCGVDGITGQ